MTHPARPLALLALALPLIGSPAFADFLILPDGGAAIDRVDYPEGPIYAGPSGGNFGSGYGFVQYHTIVDAATFDLSPVGGPIAGLSITGSVADFAAILSGVPYETYAGLDVIVTAPNLPPAAAGLAQRFAAIIGGDAAAEFIVDDGIPEFPGQMVAGPDFRITLGPGAVAAAEAAREAGVPFALGFQGLSGGLRSVEGTLSVTLDVRAVPEPSATLLMVAGVVAIARWPGRGRPRGRA